MCMCCIENSEAKGDWRGKLEPNCLVLQAWLKFAFDLRQAQCEPLKNFNQGMMESYIFIFK